MPVNDWYLKNSNKAMHITKEAEKLQMKVKLYENPMNTGYHIL